MTKIIVAEDDAFLSKAYKAKLTKAGYEVLVVGDGSEFLLNLKSFSPDIAILDLVMPKTDGFSVLEQIKADPSIKRIPIIVASNLGQTEDLQRAKALGASDYVVKSDLSMKSLIDKINKLLPAKA